MIAEIAAKQIDLSRLCDQFRVSRLELFGSAAGEGFDETRSDLDFLVDFQPLSPAEHAQSYFGLKEAIEVLFQRPVDLIETAAIKNPFFLAQIPFTRQLLYSA